MKSKIALINNTMKEEIYWQKVKHKVCVRCVDGDEFGNCLLPKSQMCALIEHFPLIVESVEKIQSNFVSDYVNVLRKTVCETCTHQNENGFCGVRYSLDCGLDRYFPLVIEAIESVEKDKTI